MVTDLSCSTAQGTRGPRLQEQWGGGILVIVLTSRLLRPVRPELGAALLAQGTTTDLQ